MARDSRAQRSFQKFNVERASDGDLVRQIVSRAVWFQLMKKPDTLLSKGKGAAVVLWARHNPPHSGALAPTSSAQKSCQGKDRRRLQQFTQRHVNIADAVANPRNCLHKVN